MNKFILGSIFSLLTSIQLLQGSNKKFLNMVWNQHQPSYHDLLNDNYSAPWVRLHCTRDYYMMASLIEPYKKMRMVINLSSVLIIQIEDYLEKLEKFGESTLPPLQRGKLFPFGKLDRNFELLVKPVEDYSLQDKKDLVAESFRCRPEAMIYPFPVFTTLFKKVKTLGESAYSKLSDEELIDLKVFYNLAWCHYKLRQSPVTLTGLDSKGKAISTRLKTIPQLAKKGTNSSQSPVFSEVDAIQLASEHYQLMKFTLPIHRKLQETGQIEVVTTPFTHPILPMIHDSNVADDYNPGEVLPNRFHYPEDARAQVIRGAKLYKKHFGKKPTGMWPGENAVSEGVIPAFVDSGIKWINSGIEVGNNSGHSFGPGMMYRIDKDNQHLDNDHSDALSILFKSGDDYIGLKFGGLRGHVDGAFGIDGSVAADYFIGKVGEWNHPKPTQLDHSIYTNLVDGENCWEYFREDGFEFLDTLYRQLNSGQYSNGFPTGVTPITPSEYLKLYPLKTQYELEPLAAGSWVSGTFSTWIGEPDEVAAWNLLGMVRKALADSGCPRPDPEAEKPKPGTKNYFAYMAWEEIYFAEGSDWFWWYGNDQNSGVDELFDNWFRLHLANVYSFSKAAGYPMTWPKGGLKALHPLGDDILNMPEAPAPH